jgi:hypothetical protein
MKFASGWSSELKVALVETWGDNCRSARGGGGGGKHQQVLVPKGTHANPVGSAREP